MIYSLYKIEGGKTSIGICVSIGIFRRKLKTLFKALLSKHIKSFYVEQYCIIAKNCLKFCVICFSLFLGVNIHKVLYIHTYMYIYKAYLYRFATLI